jgi:hypothetical protein
VPFFGAFGAAWDDGMVDRWSADLLEMLWRSSSLPLPEDARIAGRAMLRPTAPALEERYGLPGRGDGHARLRRRGRGFAIHAAAR